MGMASIRHSAGILYPSRKDLLGLAYYLPTTWVEHFIPPTKISENSNYHIDDEQDCGGVEPFPKIEGGGNDIHDNPQQPLFEVLLREHPHRHDAEGGGEGIAEGDGTVGEGAQNPVKKPPQGDGGRGNRQDFVGWHVCDSQLFSLVAVSRQTLPLRLCPFQQPVGVCPDVV